jgi:3-methyladenine DNA glycosylase AlkD
VKTPPEGVLNRPANVGAPAIAVAAAFEACLETFQSDEELAKIQRYFKSNEGEYGAGDRFMGVRMGQVFEVAKAFIDMLPSEIEVLLESPVHEVRAGACSVMDKQGRRDKTPESRRKELYELYLRRHDRINNWDLVDLAAPFVVGRYLFDKPRDVLYELARSTKIWERRTAVVATAYFIRRGEVHDTFGVAAALVADPEDLIQKAVGGWLRAAGGVDLAGLRVFLDQYAATMPRTALRYASEHLSGAEKAHYLGLKDKARSMAPPVQ